MNWSTTTIPTTNNTREGRYEEQEESISGFIVEFDVPVLVLAALIIAFNCLVLFLVVKRKQLRTQTNYLLCSLAVSDLLTGLVNVPLYLSCTITQKFEVCLLAETFLRMTSISTILHLVAISIDRYIAAKHALVYSSIMKPYPSHLIKAFIWAVAFLVAFVQLAWINPSNIVEEYVKHEIRYDIANLVVFFALPLIIMVVLYSILLKDYIWIARRQRSNKRRNECKTALVFVSMFLVYCVCWLPYFLIRLQHNIGNAFFELPHTLEYVFVYLRFINAVLNPCIYVLGKNDFWQALKGLFGRSKDGETSRENSDLETTFQHLTSSL